MTTIANSDSGIEFDTTKLAPAFDDKLKERGYFLLWNTDRYVRNHWMIANEDGEIVLFAPRIMDFANTCEINIRRIFNGLTVAGIADFEPIDSDWVQYQSEKSQRHYDPDQFEHWYCVDSGEIAIRESGDGFVTLVECDEYGRISEEHECLNPYDLSR